MAAGPGTRAYQGAALRAVAMPLGGIGTGSFALCGDGGLRQWQIFNNIDHDAHLPGSFFAIWCRPAGGQPAARVLMCDALYAGGAFSPAPEVSDHRVPDGARDLLARLPGVTAIKFRGEYPIAELRYEDTAIPLEMSLEAFSPFVPPDTRDSGLPMAFFNFTLRNPGSRAVSASLLAALQNAVGWRGMSPIHGVECRDYGGNANRAVRGPGWTGLLFSRAGLPADHPGHGTLALAAAAEDGRCLAGWDDVQQLWDLFGSAGGLPDMQETGPSAPGRTWNGALVIPSHLDPGASRMVTFVIAWHFANRYVDWDQAACGVAHAAGPFLVGNFYARAFAGAVDVASYALAHRERLAAVTRAFRDALCDSTLPPALLAAISAPLSALRSPTCFRTRDGHFYAFEGCRGASTRRGHTGGCCPLNCTHVWNYALAPARLFPELERDMREADLDLQMSPQGSVPHRTPLPLTLPRPWDVPLEDPPNPALDGELGTLLKVYREVRQGAGEPWLRARWPAVKRLVSHLLNDHDADRDGVIKGQQPNTYDSALYGPNSFIGTLYLAALRAGEELARWLDEPELARTCRDRFEQGRARLDALLWNGEYYAQAVDLQQHPAHQYGAGCHADQLFGQWWAHLLDLGYLLPEAHVRSALQAIVRYNWRESLRGFRQGPRVFADEDGPGLLNCTWPRAGRPDLPIPYCDEVWTGIEYEVAGLLLWQRMPDAAMRIVEATRSRYDGTRRNPWNEVECGDHYVRPLSSWAMLEAASGWRYDARTGSVALEPRLQPADCRCLFVARDGWGTLAQKAEAGGQSHVLHVARGVLEMTRLTVPLVQGTAFTALRGTVDRAPRPIHWQQDAGQLRISFDPRLTLTAGTTLEIVAASSSWQAGPATTSSPA